MNTYIKKSFAGFGLIVLSFAFTCVSYAYIRYEGTNKPITTSKFSLKRQNEKKRDAPVQFLTDVHASIDVAGIKGGNYTARIIRQVRFDLVRIRDIFLHFGFQEENLFESSSTQLDHEFRYLGIGYNTAKGRIGLFWDHTCYNPNRKLSPDKSNNIHWNEFGIEYKTTGLMLGHKNNKVRFDSQSEWLNAIHWGASLSKIMMKSENDYEWMVKLCLRDDLLRVASQVFFCQFSLNSIYGDRGINLNSSIEIGDRISFHLHKTVYLTPSVSYQHLYDWYSLGQGEDFLFAGFSLEMSLDQKKHTNFFNQEKAKSIWAPQFRINGGYANFIHNKIYGHKAIYPLT